MVTESEILADIQQIYRKIDQCRTSKADLKGHIAKQRVNITELELLMATDVDRVAAGKRARYDAVSMKDNIERHRANIQLFNDTIERENDNIETFHNMIKVLQEDMARPVELIIQASR